ncbi:squalene/phytoene synthase family protein [Altererythrobacter aquiaggeris]|uniref:squalene/phytoene synthase family protein n=1 Tax=Aestuarierythrobacter aquiaggeris TaxID=1898396 RepID=UPI003018EECE
MQSDRLDLLPHEQRLALTYAPREARTYCHTLMQFDARLADIVRTIREPILAQMRLAWWRDRLRDTPENWPVGEPLLAELKSWGKTARKLEAVVDGWELLIGEDQLTADDVTSFATSRGAGWAALAAVIGEDPDAAATAGADWALVDLACNLSSPEEQDTVAQILRERMMRAVALPRSLRSLAVLHTLALRAAHKNRGLLDGPGAMGLAMRVGIFGR